MIREFTYSEEAIAKQRDELQVADTTEKELWVCPRTQHTFWSIHLTLVLADGTPTTVTDELLGIVPDSGTSESDPSLCRECTTIRTTSKLPWDPH